MIDNMNWSGTLTLDNLEDVAEAIRTRLESVTYTFVTRNEYMGPDWEERRTEQQVEAWKAKDKQPVSTHRYDDWGGFNVVDTYGVWGASTFSEATITFNEQGIIIDQNAPAGHALHWEILVDEPEEPEDPFHMRTVFS